jgi:hypothetical protein
MTVSTVLFILAIPLIVVSLGLAVYQHWSIKQGTLASGTVIENVSRGKTGTLKYSPKIKFTTKTGNEIHFMTTFASNPPAYNVGDPVTVVYQGDGQDARILSFAIRYGLAWSLMGAAIALIVLAIGFKYGDQFMTFLYAARK